MIIMLIFSLIMIAITSVSIVCILDQKKDIYYHIDCYYMNTDYIISKKGLKCTPNPKGNCLFCPYYKK